MTLAESSLEMHLAEIWKDYLSSADSIRAGVPDNTALPKVLFDLAREPDLPSLVIVAKEDGTKGAFRTINLSFMHLARIGADDDAAAVVADSQTTSDVLATIARIDTRLRTMKTGTLDGTPLLGWRDWYATLDAERTAGFRITGLRFLGCAPVQRKADKRVIIAACTLDVHVRLVPV